MKLNRLRHKVQRHHFQIGGLFPARLNHRIDGRSERRSFALAILLLAGRIIFRARLRHGTKANRQRRRQYDNEAPGSLVR
jgi:hypothetical protein